MTDKILWTTKYKPIKVVELIEGDNYDEDKYTLKYMEQYGIDNVRGGSFCQIIITVDNGISAFDAIKRCDELEIDLIITDHHKIPNDIPNFYALLHI